MTPIAGVLVVDVARSAICGWVMMEIDDACLGAAPGVASDEQPLTLMRAKSPTPPKRSRAKCQDLLVIRAVAVTIVSVVTAALVFAFGLTFFVVFFISVFLLG